MDNNLTTNKYWESLNRKEVKEPNIIFSAIFDKYLIKEKNQKRKVLEIGCVPGVYLAYISKNFGYFPEGIDYVKGSRKITQNTLKNFSLHESTIYEKDFIKWKSNIKYDLVCSFGFIEHFYNTDLIIKKHMDLLKKGGQIIIEIPNFNYGQKVLHSLLDKKNLERHNTSIMNLSFFKNIANKYDLEINYMGYYGGFFNFWSENTNRSFFKVFIHLLLRYITSITRRIPINNKLFSPYIIFIATSK